MDASSDEYTALAIPNGTVVVMSGRDAGLPASAFSSKPNNAGQARVGAPIPRTAIDKLSARQREVLDLIVQGQSNKEIARTLKLAEGTVKIHVSALFSKLGVHRRAAVAIAGGVLSFDATLANQ